ncbi:MAG: hypothetical protein KKD38_02405 [Candidatus Delongbacteria bacterium]|nr:hypothetical protein [Candidatus Delongbacteria bacterium]MCG2760570.1 hypothetical protein [Candidatus Delongbacteria bacterium]
MANYNEMYLESKEKIVGLRYAIVKYADNHTKSETADYFATTRKTVGKWYGRYDGTMGSLEDHSKRPHNI